MRDRGWCLRIPSRRKSFTVPILSHHVFKRLEGGHSQPSVFGGSSRSWKKKKNLALVFPKTSNYYTNLSFLTAGSLSFRWWSRVSTPNDTLFLISPPPETSSIVASPGTPRSPPRHHRISKPTAPIPPPPPNRGVLHTHTHTRTENKRGPECGLQLRVLFYIVVLRYSCIFTTVSVDDVSCLPTPVSFGFYTGKSFPANQV